ncbi:Eco57I restriction-modification methylase domain-containing protein [Candidatus Desantisbacteria bacterium]|nr:Eco57I restriction-modification methylase domain-containing protein [Candidatus Desantisbacteria bacterium]
MDPIDFQSPYKRSEYLKFLNTSFLPEDFEEADEDLNYSTEHIQSAYKIGNVSSLDLIVYELHHKSENDPRVSISRDSFRLLSQYGKSRALIFFTSKKQDNFRFSLVTVDLKWEEGKRVTKEYSNPKRYSFYLGPDTKIHTPLEYLIKKGRVKDFEDLKNRFSIEVVNKEFYTKIAVLFTKLAGGKRIIGREKIDDNPALILPSTNDENIRKEFTVRLIGRLVFCWFLKKKHSDAGISLLPDELVSSASVQNNKNYYHNILEPLFFQALNTPVTERKKQFKNNLWENIPFLNGGLFSPHNHDFYEPGAMEISKHINTLIIPDEWILKLFQEFETYNFTIDENTSIDVELSIDPEMLGRIFENLLAEINPATGETARKATGSYYTPRPIVEYMVDQSLKEYLLTKTKVEEKKIIDLLAYEKEYVDLKDNEKSEIINALDTIKIIDPACGSGAFPMGILQKMLLVLQKIDPDSKEWLSKQISKIENIDMRKKTKEKFKGENVNYIHKIGIIQNAIYGVDIQPIAIEISKLRFFLSLIVDEKVDDAKENRGVEPLPNLEFKFVCANSLIGLPKNNEQMKKDEQTTLFEADNDITLLKNLRDEYLRSWGSEKKRIEKKFQETQSRMFQHGISWGGKDSQTMKLSQWNPFSDEACAWFDMEWMFGITSLSPAGDGGFNVVIGNPPYQGFHKINKSQKKLLIDLYESAKGKYDFYILFIEKGFYLLNQNGFFIFICPTTFTKREYGNNIRKFLLVNTQLFELIDFEHTQIFNEATNYTGIFSFKRGISQNNKLKYRTNFSNKPIEIPQKQLSENSWIFRDSKASQVINKISNNIKLKEISIISEGIVTGSNELYLRSGEDLSLNKFELTYFLPCFRGREIDKYYHRKMKIISIKSVRNLCLIYIKI